MGSETIEFGVEGVQVRAEYDLGQVALGRLVHVASRAEGYKFSPESAEGSRPFNIVSVTASKPQGARLVTLLDRQSVGTPLVLKVLAATRTRLSLADAERQLQRAAEDVPVEKLHDSSAIAQSRLTRIEAVTDRLDLVDSLAAPAVGTALWLHHQGLVTYLLLTCFDLLGQNAQWMQLEQWMNSNDQKVATERADVLMSLAGGHDALTASRALLRAYNARYGVRQAFVHFVNQILPQIERQSLFGCIDIEKRPTPPAEGDTEALDEAKRTEWLFRLRNSYTHRAAFVPGLHPENMPSAYRGDEQWWFMGREATPSKTTDYAVRRWPQVLDEAVRAGLDRFIRDL